MSSNHVLPLNVGSDELISINELTDKIIAISGKRLKKVYDTTQPQGVRGRNADLTLIQRAISWRPKVSYDEGLKVTYAWVKKMVENDSKVLAK
jgi:nucleoside-diphosphate-sugar epimerase